jgi:NAD(P)-dependent dehydrogenase (short-subunit alcohol dehydrogenase family)
VGQNQKSHNLHLHPLFLAPLNALTLIMADELRDLNIKVNAVCPGCVSTEMRGKMVPTNPQMAAKDIVHFVILMQGYLQVASSDTKSN